MFHKIHDAPENFNVNIAFRFRPPKISKQPQAIRFFKPDSIVRDWYRGQLSNVLATVNQADISFVMYYAPWDAESQYVRDEFEKAALVLKDRVSMCKKF